MAKELWKPGNMLYPLPVVMVSLADKNGKSNIITIAWAGTVCTNPPMVSISVRPERYSYPILKETGEFVINLTTKELAFATDYCGVKSGSDVDKFKEYKGAFTELFVLTQLMTEDLSIYYYSSNDSRVEIDFVVQKGAVVVPIEVKAEVNVHAKSLRTFIGKHPELKGLRLSMMPYQNQEWMENRPLYAVGNWV